MTPLRTPLVLAIGLILSAPLAHAEPATREHAHEEKPRTLTAVEVTATPLRNSVDDLTRPVSVLSGEELDEKRAATLGETLSRQPGVQDSYFGPGVGRPVIRGQDGARVQVLNGGTSSLDVSTVSADHAVAIEPFLADQIEVLKGPASLLFGSGAIGGAVNVVDGRVPSAPIGKALSGRAELRHGSNGDAAAGMVRVDGDAGEITWHLDAFRRDSDDLDIPGYAFSPELRAEEIAEGEDPAHFERGILRNSAIETEGGGVGASWLGQRAWFGAALSTFNSNYGIPPGAHGHAEGEEAEEAPVRIDLQQQRFDARGGIRELGLLKELNLRYSHADYRHVELEGDEVGTRFDNQGQELRIEAVQQDIGGWRGAFGLQWGEREFSAIGEEAFVPATDTRDIGLFVLQERSIGDFKLELGARHDRVRTRLQDGSASVSNGATSASLAGRWNLSDAWQLRLGFDRAQRAPGSEELFSDGPHIATGSYEVGDAGLGVETANNFELGLHYRSARFSGKLSLFRTGFDDFIYLDDTGLEADGLPLRQWTQADARFQGWEAEGEWLLAENETGLWNIRVFADAVDARLDSGERLPRIAPSRVGAELDWERGNWHVGLGLTRVNAQRDVAPLESPTDGYVLADAHVSYHLDSDRAGWEFFLDARNLTDEEARVHTSFLKEFLPMPGRSLSVGVRVYF